MVGVGDAAVIAADDIPGRSTVNRM